MGVSNAEEIDINIVGSSTFGRYPKISLEKTYNMFISDKWLLNYAGFKNVSEILPANGEGRGFFNSIRGKFLIEVISSGVYRSNTNLAPVFIGNIDTLTGEVFIAENLSSQICIVDGDSAYIYNYQSNTFTKQTLTFLGNPIIPSYVSYHNTFFLIGSSYVSENSQNWYVFERDTNSTIKLNTQLSLQTKSDTALAVLRLPGRGNNVLVLGSTVGEVWTQVGGIENYRRVQSFNIDSGTVAVSTIAASEELVCWLSQNENNAPSIMVTDGGSTKRISTDGIDYLLSKINVPQQSTAFFYRQDGHLFYQITFFNKKDNLTLTYDFTSGLFFHLSDENLNFHPARQIVFFNGKTYFISIRDSNIYEMSTDYVTYNYNIDDQSIGEEIPRIRIPKTVRKKDSSPFRVGEFRFWIEQGESPLYLLNTDTNKPRVDMSFSKNGNQSFSNVVSRNLNTQGNYRNIIRWNRMGQANEFTPQLRFWGFQRFVANDGVLEIY